MATSSVGGLRFAHPPYGPWHGVKRKAGSAARLVPDCATLHPGYAAIFTAKSNPRVVGERGALAMHLSAADPSLGNGDAHQRIWIYCIGVLFKDRQVSKFSRLQRAELVGHADLSRRVEGHRAQRLGQRNSLLGADDLAVNGALAGDGSLHQLERADIRAGRIGVDREWQADPHAISGRVHAAGAFLAE